MIKKQRICLLALFAVILWGVCFISNNQDEVNTGKQEITLAAARDLVPGPEDPYYASIILKVWEPLIGISDDGHAVPALAESWEANDDKTEWTFFLKKNVYFQDAEPFNAEAVSANFDRYCHMGYRPSSFYGFFVERIYPGLKNVEVLDSYTVKLTFNKPVPMLIYRMAGWGSAIFSPKCFDRTNGNFTSTARGTGPFEIVEYKPYSYVVIQRFNGYYGEKAKAERIRIRTIPSVDTRYSAMRSGEVHGVLDLGGLTPVMVRDLQRAGHFNVDSAHSTISHYLSVNGGRFPFNDERMRKALDLAIDRDKIVKYYFCGFGTPTRSFLNSTNPFGKVIKPQYELEEAKKLAGEALQGKRQTIKFLLPQYGMARYPYKIISEFIQAELKPLGLDVDIVMVDSLTSRKMMAEGDYDLSIGTRGLGNLDPTSLLQEFFTTNGATNKASHFNYSNPQIDEDFYKLDKTYDLNNRKLLYDDILHELLEHPAVIPLLEDENIAVSSDQLDGYHAAVYGITLDKIRWSKE